MNNNIKDDKVENINQDDNRLENEMIRQQAAGAAQIQDSNDSQIVERSSSDKSSGDETLEEQGAKDQAANSSEMIALLQEEIADLHDKLLRSFAESENIRNRSAKMIEESKLYSINNFAKDLLPVLDNFSRTLQHAPKEITGELKIIMDGVSMTKNELETVFAKHGLECISPQKGEKFDYNKHNAISQIVTDEFQAGTIVDTMQVGYKIKDRLLRPAVVTVAK